MNLSFILADSVWPPFASLVVGMYTAVCRTPNETALPRWTADRWHRAVRLSRSNLPPAQRACHRYWYDAWLCAPLLLTRNRCWPLPSLSDDCATCERGITGGEGIPAVKEGWALARRSAGASPSGFTGTKTGGAYLRMPG